MLPQLLRQSRTSQIRRRPIENAPYPCYNHLSAGWSRERPPADLHANRPGRSCWRTIVQANPALPMCRSITCNAEGPNHELAVHTKRIGCWRLYWLGGPQLSRLWTGDDTPDYFTRQCSRTGCGLVAAGLIGLKGNRYRTHVMVIVPYWLKEVGTWWRIVHLLAGDRPWPRHSPRVATVENIGVQAPLPPTNATSGQQRARVGLRGHGR